jgi:hypothetical protein
MGCIPCHHATEYLSQMRMGLRLLPVIAIGDKRLSGFKPQEIDAALAG